MSLSSFQRRRRELAAKQEAQQSKEVEANSQVNPIESNVDDEQTAAVDVDGLTKNEIMAKLDELKVDYNSRDNKETLKGLLIDATA